MDKPPLSFAVLAAASRIEIDCTAFMDDFRFY
jgi:hypothetical protein